MKIFGYTNCPENQYGIAGSIIFANNIEEAKRLIDFCFEEDNVWEIEVKNGVVPICSHFE